MYCMIIQYINLFVLYIRHLCLILFRWFSTLTPHLITVAAQRRTLYCGSHCEQIAVDNWEYCQNNGLYSVICCDAIRIIRFKIMIIWKNLKVKTDDKHASGLVFSVSTYGRSYLTIPYRQIRNYLMVPYRQKAGTCRKCYLMVPWKMAKLKILKILLGHDYLLSANIPVQEFCRKLLYWPCSSPLSCTGFCTALPLLW
jgi:hypothetical protein